MRPRRLWRQVAEGTGLEAQRRLERRIAALEEAAAEERALVAALEGQVDELERVVLQAVDARAGHDPDEG